MAGNAFTTSADIVNRALQRVGAARITALTDNTKNAKECAFCYDKLRRAELRRNVWRFATRRVIMRAVGTALQTWNSALSYSSGAYATFGGTNYISLANGNMGNEPDTSPGSWQVFLGNTTLKVTFSAWSNVTAYTQGMVVTGSDSRLYIALGATTGNDPTATTGFWALYFGTYTAAQFDSLQTYDTGELVFYPTNNAIYSSLMNGNSNDPTGANSGWVLQTCTAAPLVILWPAGVGPLSEPLTKNAYVLPSGYMRRAPEDPSAGRISFMGFPTNLPATDWIFEGNLMLTMDSGPVMLRFIADVTDVLLMDDLFCEGLASRIALEVCEPLTQSNAKIQTIASEYKQFMGDARGVNAIENGAVPPPLDDYIMARF